MDGKVIDSSLSRDPLVVELGKRTVIAGMLNMDPFVVAPSVIFSSDAECARFVYLLCLCVIFLSGLEQSLVGVCEG